MAFINLIFFFAQIFAYSGITPANMPYNIEINVRFWLLC